MDMTYIVTFAILLVGAVLAALAGYAWKKWIQPWIEAHQLEAEAQIVVNAVEAILGRYTGEDKWKLALVKMQEYGWNIDEELVLDALRAAWKMLDLKQIGAGVKLPDEGATAKTEE